MKLLKKSLSLVMIIVMVLGFHNYMPITSAKADDVIEIRTVEDLYAINNNMSGNYVLMNDIDLSEATAPGGDWDFLGNGWEPIGSNGVYGETAFTGTFDGRGHTIKGLRISINTKPTDAGNYLYLGLFSCNQGIIENLNVSGRIDNTYNTGYYAGFIASHNDSSGIIRGCKAYGTIDLSTNETDRWNGNQYASAYLIVAAYAGGITHSNDGNIEECCNYSNISCKGTNKSTAKTNISVSGGGIARICSATGKVSDCFNLGTINCTSTNTSSGGSSGTDSAGIVCNVSGTGAQITNCYNCGEIKGSGIVYWINGSGIIDKCYNVGKVTGYPIYERGSTNSYYLKGSAELADNSKELTELQMKMQSMFTGFDFNNTWIIDDKTEYKYPQLRNNRQVTDKEIDIIEWKSMPNKLSYYTGDKIDATGGEITVYYMDGTSEDFDVTNEMLSGYDLSQTGTQTVNATYRNKTVTYQIQVEIKPNIVSVSQISGPNKTEFVRGTAFDFTGWKLQIVYDNATSEVIDVTEDMTTGGNINASGTYDITCSYGGSSFVQTVKVVPVKVSGVEVKKLPNKLTYVEGEDLDISGMVVSAVYNNGATQNIIDYEVSGYESTIGVHTIKVKYAGFETSFDVTVEEGNVIALSIKKLPNKTQYVDGQTFDPSGLVVEVTYEGGFKKEIDNYTLSDMLPGVGSQNITVSYQNKSTYFTINVVQKQLQALEITHLPNKTTYVELEPFVQDGLVVCGVYNDGTKTIINNYTLSGNNTNTVGDKVVTVVYSGKTAEFGIKVVPAQVQSISVTPPIKAEYLINEQLDLSGMVVFANYDNGRSEEVTGYSISGYTGEVGTNFVKVTYQGQEWIFTVIVHEPYGDWVVTKAPTCTETGTHVKRCRECGNIVLTETMPALGHKEVIDEEIPATCIKNGWTEGLHCERCEEVLVARTQIPALGHAWGEYESNHDATCTADGTKTAKCIRCEVTHTITDAGSKLEHEYELKSKVDATESETGAEEYVCKHCNDTYYNYIPKIEPTTEEPTTEEPTTEELTTEEPTTEEPTTEKTTDEPTTEKVTEEATTENLTTQAVTDATTIKPEETSTTKAVVTKQSPQETTVGEIVNNNTTKIKKIKAKKKSLVIIWKKVNGISGYKIQYSTKKNFKNAKARIVKKSSATKVVLKKLKKKKKYYVRIRTYQKIDGRVYYSKWSKAKVKKTK